jgi:probable HAF family extracellular repeat protein
MTLFVALAVTIQLSAQDNPRSPAHHYQYQLMQVGTFGGPWSDIPLGPAFSSEPDYFNIQGAAVGGAQTDMADPFYPNCFFSNCLATYAFKFQDGRLTNLGALPGSYNSVAYGINDAGLVVGLSENGSIDPATGYPEYHAVVWRNGAIRDLGTFGGNESQAFAVNHWGQVVGVAGNAVPDQYANGLGPNLPWIGPVTTQQRAFLWEGGRLQDLGTLGGNDAAAYFVNDSGQVAGISYTNTTPNQTTGLPTQDPFLWEGGRMVDLGTLGGTWGIVYWLNNRGQVAGQSNLAGDQAYHAFLWDRGVLTDLGTLGGDTSTTYWLNHAGDVVGASLITGNQYNHAFLWRHGTMTDLGTVAGDTSSYAESINPGGQIVGPSCNSQGACRAFVWENGGPMVDLNTLVPPSNLYLTVAYAISDSGEIYAIGNLPNGDIRIAVLKPDGDCDSGCEERIAASQSDTAIRAGASQATTTMTSNASPSGRGAAARPNLFGSRQLTPPQRAVPSN